ncbi:ATP-binding cassette domain-containing protein [Peptostreptococcus canis]|uniref:ATP-binding cassette domain-containing protein n=1 Tax=Peptostreptococcus canis TaxID=1159213 RepID=A0ABR6TK11_9FIRM|nr:ATP-binding cassette domain-containing protein [Peptostreptococcus canis]MBC2575573.1 ATP-binding cassette domain-containing protein [Peptostreptococcus canis]
MRVQEVKKIIKLKNVYKEYIYYKKDAGLKGSIKNLFSREILLKSAVRNLSFEVSEGEIVGLIGLNGAGKSTTLKMLSGLILPTKGEISVLGYKPFDKKKEYLKQISMVMGNKSQLWWDLPALDSFGLNKTIYEIDEKEYRETLNLMVDILNVKEQLNTQVRRLSLGERMKMELIAALIHKPKIIFLDEPTIGLDVITQYHIREFLKEYCKKYRTTIILTSHNFNDIIYLCDSLILINKGEKIYSDSFKNFKNEFLNEKLFVLKFKETNASKFIKDIKNSTTFLAEKLSEDSIKIIAYADSSLDVLKNISENLINELKDINIENISMDDVIRRIYQS